MTISIWHQWSGDYLNAIEEAFAAYTEMHPNVTIDLSKPEDVSSALAVAIPAGEGPDIIAWANDQIGTNALAGNIVPLNDYGVDTTFLNSTYEPAAVRGVIWQDMIWGLPETQEGIAFVYNKDMVGDEYLPTDPTDFADLLAKADSLLTQTPASSWSATRAWATPTPTTWRPSTLVTACPSMSTTRATSTWTRPRASPPPSGWSSSARLRPPRPATTSARP